MDKIKNQSISMVVCDLPFGCTQNKWDIIISFEPMWKQIYRVTKQNAAIVLMGIQPFFSDLINSNRKDFRYELIWKMKEHRNFLNAKRMPLRQHINIGVWYRALPSYFPQKTHGHKAVNKYKKYSSDGSNYGKTLIGVSGGGQTDRYPTTIIDIPYKTIKNRIHPTQKPVELYEWLIKTYTSPGETILDFASGSGTAAIAAWNTLRSSICVEKDIVYYNKSIDRFNKHTKYGYQLSIFDNCA